MRAKYLLLSLAVMSCVAHGGTVLQVAAKDSSGKTTPDEVYYAQDGMMRIDSLDSQGNVVRMNIIRDGGIWQVDTRNRTFSRIDQQSVSGIGSSTGAQNSPLQAMMANLPADKRAMMQARLAQMGQPRTDSTFTDTGRSDQSAQYSCHVWQEQRQTGLHAEYCVVAPSSLPDGADFAASMRAAIDTANKIIAGIPMMAARAEHLTRLDKMNGFPVRWRYVSSTGGTENEHVLTSAQAQNLPADTFAIPQGFTEKPLGRGTY